MSGYTAKCVSQISVDDSYVTVVEDCECNACCCNRCDMSVTLRGICTANIYSINI